MKTFYYMISETTNRKIKAHKDVRLQLLKIVKNKPVYICTHEYNSGSCMGVESEALQALVKFDVLPKKYEGKYSHEIPHRAIRL